MRPEDIAYAAYKERPCDETQDALYKAVVAQARNIVYMILHRERMDLAANAATFAVLNLETYRGDSAFSTWSHRIARNVAYREAEKLNARKEDSLADMDPEHMPLDTGLDGYAASLMADIVKTLDPVDQKILEYKLFGMSVEEICEELDLTEGAVWMRWTRIKEQILKLLKRS
jgi:RNA polymerase sigma factor (sigma-70 family)